MSLLGVSCGDKEIKMLLSKSESHGKIRRLIGERDFAGLKDLLVDWGKTANEISKLIESAMQDCSHQKNYVKNT